MDWEDVFHIAAGAGLYWLGSFNGKTNALQEIRDENQKNEILELRKELAEIRREQEKNKITAE